MIAVMEHLRNPDHILKQISAFLKPDGMLVMTPQLRLGVQIHTVVVRIGFLYKETADQ